MNKVRSLARPRPGRPKSPEKHHAIVEAAGKLFLNEGLSRTSMDAVAAEAGVSKQTVYSHFKSKDDLFRACVIGKIEDHELDTSHLPHGLPIDEALGRIGRQYLELVCDPQVVGMFRLLIAECVAYPKISRVFHAAGPETTLRNVAGMLGEAAERDELRIDDPETAADLFLTLVKGNYFIELLMNVRRSVSAAERKRHVAATVQRFLKLYDA